MKKLSIVIPVYNSEKTIEEVINEVEIAVSKLNSKYGLERVNPIFSVKLTSH